MEMEQTMEQTMEKLKFIDLFCGIGGFHQALTSLGHECVLACDIDKFCQQNYKENYGVDVVKDVKEINETNVPDFDIITGGFPCFVAGTKVLTLNGYKNIEDISLNDKLMTHTGKFQNILNLQRKNYTGMLYNIRIKYHPENIVCTKGHPFYVREKDRTLNVELKKKVVTFKQPEWKSAKELTMNDYFGMKINENDIIPEFSFDKKINTYSTTNILVKLDNPDMWFMMGYFVGDGWIEETTKPDGRCMNKIRFAINVQDEEYVCRIINNILPITDKKCASGNKCNKYGCSDFVWFNILKSFGKYAHGKLIPEWVQDAPKEYIEQFIDGYRMADGYIKKNGSTNFTTVSYNLAFGLQRLYLKLGYIFGISKDIRPKTTVIEGRTVNQRDTYCVSGYVKENKRNYSSFIENGYVWYAPFKIEKQEQDENEEKENIQVYNFEVENDNSYIVENTIVKNCQGFSGAGKKLADDPRNTLFREFLRAAKIIEPTMIIGENVKGLLSRKTTSGEPYIDVIVKEFENIGYNVEYKVLKVNEYGVPQKRERLIIIGTKEGNSYKWTSKFPEPCKEQPNLKNIIKYDMTDAIRVDPNLFNGIPEECIIKNMRDKKEYDEDNGAHPYLKRLYNADEQLRTYKEKTHDNLFSFGKRISPIHAEIIDIRGPAKTIICTYNHQPRFFVPIKNKSGTYLRTILPDELKQIQGFPADYKIAGNNKQQIVQVGNAVPPPLIEKIVKNIIGE